MKSKGIELVPFLRFKGFDVDHCFKVFNDLVKVIDCKHRTPPYIDEGIPVVSPGSIKWGEIDLITPKKRVSEEEYDSLMDHCDPKVNDLVFSRNQSIGVASIVTSDDRFVLGQDTVLIQSIKVNPIYNYYRIQTQSVQNSISRLSGGSTFSRINLKDLRKLSFLISPSLPEQQKIATFLSAVDQKIQQLTRKKELLETYKKGLMQQLFSGDLRFKDEEGKAYPDWEEKRLGDIGEIVSGLTYSPDDIHEDGVLVLRSSNVKKRSIFLGDNVYVKTNKFNPVVTGDVLICVRNGSKRLIGKNALISDEVNGVAFGAFMSVYRSRYNQYVFHFFNTSTYKKEVHKNLGATINSINGSDLKKFKIPFPSVQEQFKIARFLNTLDSKIASISTQITQTQTFKKGLLQQMFV